MLSWVSLQNEWILILLALGCYLPEVLLSLIKFRRWPTLHTYLAKLTHLLVVIAGICLVLEWSIWPLRIALTFLMLTNLESLLIVAMMKHWQTDVGSLFELKSNNPANDSK